MLTFFTDESLAEKGVAQEYKVSVYGGLVLRENTFGELTQFLYKAKDRYSLPQESEIKWRFGTVWKQLQTTRFVSFTAGSKPRAYEAFKDDYDRLKKGILNRVAESDAEIIVAIRPNHLIHASEEQRIEFSIGAVARKFEKLLTRENEFGVILADELPKKINDTAVIDHQYILNLCCSKSTPLERLLSIIPTINSNVSAIHQINDVVLGAIQYYILEFIRQLRDPSHNMDTAEQIMRTVVKRFHTATGAKFVINNGILLYPPRTSRYGTAGSFLNSLEQKLKDDFGIV